MTITCELLRLLYVLQLHCGHFYFSLLLHVMHVNGKYTGCYDYRNGYAAHCGFLHSGRQSLSFTQVAYKNVLRATE